jgi:CheY-like chemotaxis protein
MPIMNGIEFLKEIKKNENLNSIPVIIHTTSFNPIDIKMCQELGISGYFVKELDMVKYKVIVILFKLYIKYYNYFKTPNNINTSLIKLTHLVSSNSKV